MQIIEIYSNKLYLSKFSGHPRNRSFLPTKVKRNFKITAMCNWVLYNDKVYESVFLCCKYFSVL